MKFNEVRQAKFLEGIRQGLSKSQAAESAGVCRETVFKLLRQDPSFANALTQAEIDACEPVEAKLRDMALAGHFGAMLEWLRAHMPDKYTPRSNKEVTHKHPDLTEEQCRELLKQRGLNPD